MKSKLNEEFVQKLKLLHEKLRSKGVPEESYHLLGIFGSTSDDQKISLNIKKGKYTISFETYYKERGEKHSIREFSNLDEACNHILDKAIEMKTTQKHN